MSHKIENTLDYDEMPPPHDGDALRQKAIVTCGHNLLAIQDALARGNPLCTRRGDPPPPQIASALKVQTLWGDRVASILLHIVRFLRIQTLSHKPGAGLWNLVKDKKA